MTVDKEINKKLIQDENKIWVLAAVAYDYVVPFRPYQGVKKGKQAASTTKWGLGENVVLRLIECLTLTFSFDIFLDLHHLVCLPASDLTAFEQKVFSTKVG